MRTRPILEAALSGAALLLGAPALAQSDSADIVVTAQKRAESAQDVPISIAVLPADRLATEGVKDLLQAAPLVSGMIFSRAPDDGLGISFRGLGTISRSQELEQPISLSEDGVPIAKGRLYTAGLFDMDRIEFIKGSESSLLGKNSSLGAVSIVNRQPGTAPSFDASAGYEAADGGYMLDAAGTMPLGDTAAVRVAAHWNDLDGWVHNDARDHDGPQQKDLGLRAILHADATETLRVTASYQYADNRQIGESMQLVGAIPARYGDGTLDDHLSEATSYTHEGETTHRTRSHFASLKGELALGDYTLVSQTGFVGYSLGYLDDMDFSTDDTVNFRRDERYWQASQELRLQSPTGGRVDYMAGAFFLASHWRSAETQYWAVPDFPPPPDPASGQLFNGAFRNDFTEDTRTYAVYASGSWKPVAGLRLSGGVRYSHVEKDVVSGRTAIGPVTLWNSIANPPFDPTPLTHHTDFGDGNVSVQYTLRRDVTAYASYGHGSEAGGFVETNTIAVPPSALVGGKVPGALVAAGSAIRDEIANSYELGVKTLWLNRRLRVNVAAFWTEVHDFQDNVFTGGPLGFITFNGPARSRGFELDSGFNPTRRLSLDAALTYADATAVIQPIDPATDAPQVDAAGNPVYGRYRRSQAPRLIVNAGAGYTVPLGERLDLRFDALLHHRSMMCNQRQDFYRSAPLTTLDLSAPLRSRDGRWEAQVTAKNVTNAIAEDFASAPPDPRFAAFYGAHAASPNRLRTVMLTGRLHY